MILQIKELLIRMKQYIEETEYTIAGEWGSGEELEYLITEGKMPKLYYDILNELSKIKP